MTFIQVPAIVPDIEVLLMRMMKNTMNPHTLFLRKTLLVAALLVPSLMPLPAYAYLDPGTGSVILQVVIAAVLGALFTLKLYWNRLRGWLRSLFESSSGGSAPKNGVGS